MTEIIKPATLLDQLRKIEVGEQIYIPVMEYKLKSIRNAADVLKKEGVVLAVSEKGLRDRTRVIRLQ
ncbi:MAG: hypothetical protein E7110_01715 [Bacteroidales bacterium]|nr:hypothetical protein [Bacteroidales bacterium]